MQVKILLFGATADEVGSRELVRDSAGKTSDEFLKEFVCEFPGLAKHKLLLAVNQEYARGSEILNEGDEIAVFTAVSGG